MPFSSEKHNDGTTPSDIYLESEDDNSKSSSESEFKSSGATLNMSGGHSALPFLNFMREVRRRYGSMCMNIASQRWRAMSSEQRARYRGASHLPGSVQDAEHSPTLLVWMPSDCSLKDNECGKKMSKRRRKSSCGKAKRKKSSCAKRRRQKSACKKQKRTKSACSKKKRRKSKSCSKPKPKSCGKKRRKSRAAKCHKPKPEKTC